jgi:putative membrane protein
VSLFLKVKPESSITSTTPKIDRQREHQANERTFLSWLRTSIALIGFGLATARFGLFLRELQSAVTRQDVPTRSFISSQSLGVSLVVVGIAIIPLAVWSYNQVFWQIERADYQPNRLLVWLTATVVMIIGIFCIPLVLWRHPVVNTQSSVTHLSHEASSEGYTSLVEIIQPQVK